MSISIPSEERTIQEGLESDQLSTWGFVVYRTSYASDADWRRFRDTLDRAAAQLLARSDVPELQASFAYSYVDAPELQDTSVAALRTRFLAWRASPAAQAEQPRAPLPVTDVNQPRYEYFVRADERVIRSVLDGGEGAYVHFVQALWEADGDEYDDELLEPLEGCRERDVGWVCLPLRRLPVEVYVAFGTSDGWSLEYSRPPVLSVHPLMP